MILRPVPLTKKAFQPYGDVIEADSIDPQIINFGQTKKFGNLAEVSIRDAGSTQISIYRSKSIDLPFRIRLMECHPLGSQAFYPLSQQPFPIIVARAGEPPGLSDLCVFLTNGQQGINLHPGVWHHYQLTLLQDADYLVVDRGGKGENYREHGLAEEVWLDL